MEIYKTPQYRKLELRFRERVERDLVRAIELVRQGRGVYLPCIEPTKPVDYILVGMEPTRPWDESVEQMKKEIAAGWRRNFAWPSDPKSRLTLFRLSIQHYLCQPGETYHLTDVSKGAMPASVGGVDRERRYEKWYPLLLEEIELVGKPCQPVIAIGKKVEDLLKSRDFKENPKRPLHRVLHYSLNASAAHNKAAEDDKDGFERFKKEGLCANGCWPADLTPAMMRMVFSYKKQFEKIRATEPQVSE